MRKLSWFVVASLVGCATTSSPPPREPCKPVPCTPRPAIAKPKPAPAAVATKPGPKSHRPPGPSPSLTPSKLRPRKPTKPAPPWAGQLSSNCQAKLAFTEEVTRLLVKAAAHATSSSACVDGPGERVSVDQILVCPGRIQKKRALLYSRYQVTRTGEGDTRMCGPGGCSWTKPVSTTHHAAFTFDGYKGGYRIQIPAKVPGLEDATPLNRTHKGGCYGQSGPFVPQIVQK